MIIIVIIVMMMIIIIIIIVIIMYLINTLSRKQWIQNIRRLSIDCIYNYKDYYTIGSGWVN